MSALFLKPLITPQKLQDSPKKLRIRTNANKKSSSSSSIRETAAAAAAAKSEAIDETKASLYQALQGNLLHCFSCSWNY